MSWRASSSISWHVGAAPSDDRTKRARREEETQIPLVSLRGAHLRSTVNAQAISEVSRIHAELNRGRSTGGESLGGAAVIVRHQRESASNQGFRQLARYIRGRDAKPRATWLLAANLPGVTGTDDLELACRKPW